MRTPFSIRFPSLLYTAGVLPLLAWLAAASCSPPNACPYGHYLIKISDIQTPSWLPVPTKLHALLRINGVVRTTEVQRRGVAFVRDLALCVDPELGTRGTSELRVALTSTDAVDATTVGAEFNLTLQAEQDVYEQRPVRLRRARVCNHHGWCWENPFPQGAGLTSVATKDPDSVWAVGAAGTILHYNGGFWQRLSVPYSDYHYSVWVDENDDAWVGGGQGLVYHCTNLACRQVSKSVAGTIYKVAGFDSKTVYAIGPGVQRCDRMGCTPLDGIPAESYVAARVVDKDTAYFAGTNGTLVRCKKGQCTKLVTNTTKDLSAISIDDQGTLYAVGVGGTMLSCVNDRCTAFATGTTDLINAVVAVSPQQILLLVANKRVLSCDETTCHTLISQGNPTFTDLYAASPRSIWVSGYIPKDTSPGIETTQGVVIHCDGNQCSPAIVLDETSSLFPIAASDAENIWSVGYPGVIVQCGESRGCLPRYSGATLTLSSVTGDSMIIWASGQKGSVVRCDARSGCITPTPAVGTWQLSISGATTDRVWTSGVNGAVSTCTEDGCTSLRSPPGQMLGATWPSGRDAAWIAGGGMTLLHCKKADNCQDVPTEIAGDAFSMWSAVPDSVWVAAVERVAGPLGQRGVVLRCTTAGCEKLDSDPDLPTTASVTGFASQNDDVWVAGQNGLVTRCSATSNKCRKSSNKNTAHLLRIYAATANTAYAVGKEGTGLYCKDFMPMTMPMCTAIATGTNTELGAIAGSGPERYFIGGYAGTLMRCANESCAHVPKLTNVGLSALLVPDAQTAWVVGGAGAVLRLDPDWVAP